MILLISYDLKGRERPSAYEDVKRVIDRYSISALRPLYSQWLVETNEDPDAWTERLRSVMDDDDNLLIVMMNPTYGGWLAKATWEWISVRV